MAYIDQARKTTIHAALKAIIPAGWKWSLAINHHSTLVLTIQAAPVDLIGDIAAPRETRDPSCDMTYVEHWAVNTHYLDRSFNGERLDLFKRIDDAMNMGNHDNSDLMADYFDVGWYTKITIGRWNKPFVFRQAPSHV